MTNFQTFGIIERGATMLLRELLKTINENDIIIYSKEGTYPDKASLPEMVKDERVIKITAKIDYPSDFEHSHFDCTPNIIVKIKTC